jgi:hypothetical protein
VGAGVEVPFASPRGRHPAGAEAARRLVAAFSLDPKGCRG